MERWFALYYVPSASSPFYRSGSQLLGYDVRAGRGVERGAFEDIPEAWVAAAQGFGFHLSVTEAMTFDPNDLGALEEEVAHILGSFSPMSEMALTLLGLERWKQGEVWVLRYRASRALELLQAVLVARLSSFGKTSMFFEEVREHPERYAEAYERRRLETFLSPRGLDTWAPHFTLLNPFPKREDGALAERLAATFSAGAALNCATFCLLVREKKRWRIQREYPWPP